MRLPFLVFVLAHLVGPSANAAQLVRIGLDYYEFRTTIDGKTTLVDERGSFVGMGYREHENIHAVAYIPPSHIDFSAPRSAVPVGDSAHELTLDESRWILPFMVEGEHFAWAVPVPDQPFDIRRPISDLNRPVQTVLGYAPGFFRGYRLIIDRDQKRWELVFRYSDKRKDGKTDIAIPLSARMDVFPFPDLNSEHSFRQRMGLAFGGDRPDAVRVILADEDLSHTYWVVFAKSAPDQRLRPFPIGKQWLRASQRDDPDGDQFRSWMPASEAVGEANRQVGEELWARFGRIELELGEANLNSPLPEIGRLLRFQLLEKLHPPGGGPLVTSILMLLGCGTLFGLPLGI